jgi:hypothetical protein
MQVDTLEPVRWKIRAAMSLPDMWMVIKAMMRPSNLKILFSRKWAKEAEHPGEF